MTALVVFTGPPGSGKSTLAEVAAGELGGIAVLGWDWVMAGMTRFDAVQDALRLMGSEPYRAIGWSIIWNLSVAQLRSGRSVVVDGVARDMEVEQARALAGEHDADCFVVVTSCSDRSLHRTRVEGRRRNIPGWHELRWAGVERLLAAWSPPAGADVSLDAAETLAHNVQLLRAGLRRVL